MTEQHIESIRRRIRVVVAARQALQADGTGSPALEENRQRIVGLQRELCHALIALYVPGTVEEAA